MSDLDLLVVGAGPTGLAIGAEARQANLQFLIADRGAVTQALLDFPTNMTFFTTRDLLEIAGMPFSVPDDKPNRQQALVYYRGVATRYDLPFALHEEMLSARADGAGFVVSSRGDDGRERLRRTRAVALATGYFGQARRLGVPGEDLPWVRGRYLEPYGHFGEHVVVVGGGNSAAEVALELWRNGSRVTLVHRGAAVKPTVKYWVKPDIENRLAAGQIDSRMESRVVAFADHQVELETPRGRESLTADCVYVLIGYTPDAELLRRFGVHVDPVTLIPDHDPSTCESNTPGVYVAGTLQSGRDTGKIFIENSRDHGGRIVQHLLGRLRRPLETVR
ncbi:MAG: YpdA family putative bacillithiol disulfide reductase [Acidobacteriota bacterium]